MAGRYAEQGIAGQARNDREIDFKNNYKLLNNKQ
jgi:hypothetical protein